MKVTTDIDALGAPPLGFKFSAMHCGIKQARPDLALIVCDPPTSAAGVFTQNPSRAPSVERDATLVPRGDLRAIVVNSGNANAMTGAAGVRANDLIANEAARALGCQSEQVLTMSTGVVGVPLAADKISAALPALTERATADPRPFAHAILTTDTITKVAAVTIDVPGSDTPIRMLGVAKGSGMVHPNMATTLAFVCTDAAIDAAQLQAMLSAATPRTFNAICVDGDTSTNDAVAVLASGASGVAIQGSQLAATFAEALTAVLASLARQVVIDGEGATRLMEVEVRGAPDERSARLIARGVCRSSLVKCSMFAGQADWGRVAAAAGQAVLEHELSVDPRTMTILAQGIELYSLEGPRLQIPESELARRMRDSVVRWTLHLGDGPGDALALGCDLSYDYVRINADEAQQIEVTDDGVVRQNPGLDSYSPRLKHQLLVDGLAYVRRFSGLRMVVYVPPQAVHDDALDKLARDLALCLDATLRPLLVVPNEAMAQQVLHHMQGTGHYCAAVTPDPRTINRMLDRGYLGVLVHEAKPGHEVVDLAIKLAAQKLLVMGTERGLRDERGFISCIHRDDFVAGHDAQRFLVEDPQLLDLARYGADQGIPAFHLVDLRLSHALVGELFTDAGIGTLITRQATG